MLQSRVTVQSAHLEPDLLESEDRQSTCDVLSVLGHFFQCLQVSSAKQFNPLAHDVKLSKSVDESVIVQRRVLAL